jgi:hypothetical protein
MEITPKQQRNMYAIFIGLFAVSTVVSIWNAREQHKLRKMQQQLTQKQLETATQSSSEGV